MRQMEAGIITMAFVFLGSANCWIDCLLNPAYSWKTFFGLFIFAFLSYMFHQLFWLNKSIHYMIDCRAQNIAEIEIEGYDQATSPVH